MPRFADSVTDPGLPPERHGSISRPPFASSSFSGTRLRPELPGRQWTIRTGISAPASTWHVKPPKTASRKRV